MEYDAVILAGGENHGELLRVAPYANEAMILIGEHPMIYYVVKALRQAKNIKRIVISGPVDKLQAILSSEKDLHFVQGGQNAIESFSAAVDLLKEAGISDYVLVMPTDIPFITPEAIDDFIARSQQIPADFYYAITSRETNEAKFPGVKRTYVKLRDGIFTGGNLFIIKGSFLDKAKDMAVKLYQRRKSPLAMGGLFGLGLVIKYFLGRLSIDGVERRFYQVLEIKGKAVISPYAEVGVDVDKPSDLELARNYLTEAK